MVSKKGNFPVRFFSFKVQKNLDVYLGWRFRQYKKALLLLTKITYTLAINIPFMYLALLTLPYFYKKYGDFDFGVRNEVKKSFF